MINDHIAINTVLSDGDSPVCWFHLDATKPESREWLNSEMAHLDPYVVDALLADETRPRMSQINDGMILVLRGVNLNKGQDPEDMVSIRLWVEKDRIISFYRRPLKAIKDIEESISAGRGPVDAGDFICKLIARLFKRIEPVLTDMDEATDDIEETIIESADISQRKQITEIRKMAIMFRRYMVPQRDAIDAVRMSNLPWITDKHRRQLQENYNHIMRYIEDLDAIRERAQVIKDELASMLSDKLNKNMYVLSVISAIFLPLGFLTGLLGVNVGGIPGSDTSFAFTLFCVFLTVLVGIQIYIFKRLQWF
ncbi:MAG: zinc transporter ZntB [Akkermansiaceae bacterium]